MVTKQLEEGYVAANAYLHAAERRLQGLCAMCGAGKIIKLVPGRFDPDDDRACPVCVRDGEFDEIDLSLL